MTSKRKGKGAGTTTVVAKEPAVLNDLCVQIRRCWLLTGSEQILASRYQPWLPTEAEIESELTRDRALLESARANLAGI